MIGAGHPLLVPLNKPVSMAMVALNSIKLNADPEKRNERLARIIKDPEIQTRIKAIEAN